MHITNDSVTMMKGKMNQRRSIPVIVVCVLTTLTLLPHLTSCRKHHLELSNDIRRFFKISTFGYSLGGELILEASNFSFKKPSIPSEDKYTRFGFTLIRTMSDSLNQYQEARDRVCFDDDIDETSSNGYGIVSLVMDMRKEEIIVKCTPELQEISIYDENSSPSDRSKRAVVVSRNVSSVFKQQSPDHDHLQTMSEVFANNNNDVLNKPDLREERRPTKVEGKDGTDYRAAHQAVDVVENQKQVDKQSENHSKNVPDQNSNVNLPNPGGQSELNNEPIASGSGSITLNQDTFSRPSSCRSLDRLKLKKTTGKDGIPRYSFSLKMLITRVVHEGLYTVFFHSCANYEADPFDLRRLTKVNITLEIMEKNLDSYLSAGEIPLPELYFALSVIFFILSFVWLNVLHVKRQDCFPLHVLMLSLVVVKALALLFHGINFHYISVDGSQVETWAILFYVTHLLKGALLLITIVLIGTGWAFVKQILSDKDKNLFMIAIPLQVLANVAEIITQETEEGSVIHNKWREIFILVDMICCMAVLFPVVWSIRHLQEAAHVDGKAAVNLKKLKLFRRFYVIVVSYIYFTRFIVYLLKMTVPFQYEWMDVFIQHAAIFVFFVVTGYHFQPTPRNPYFRVNQDDDLEMEEVLFEVTPNTYTESINRVNQNKKNGRKSATVVEVDPEDSEGDDRSKLISKMKESSLDYD